MKLPPFKLKTKCAKCGGSDVKVYYRGPIADDACWYARKYHPIGKWPEHEYQHRACMTCQHEWPEAVIAKTAA